MHPITVFIPVYNKAPYIKEAIESILTQTFQDFELLIIDDCSTDNSIEVIKSIEDTRIRLIENEQNLGVRKTSNIAFKVANGRYLVRMDGDDISISNRLEKQFNFMEDNPSIILSGGQIELFGKETGIWNFPTDVDDIKSGMFWGNTVCQGTSIFRRDFFISNNLFYNEEGENYAEDWEFFYKLTKLYKLGNSEDILIKYRRGEQNITHQLRGKSKSINSKMHAEILKDFGLEGVENEIHLTRLALGKFSETSITSKTITEIRNWLDLILKNNNKKDIFPVESFKNLVEIKWEMLFYKLPKVGFNVVLTYFRVTKKMKFRFIIYYLKFYTNHLSTKL